MLIEVRRQLLGTGEVNVGGDDMPAVLCDAAAGGRADSTRRACDQHDVTRKLALRWCHFEFVLFERPVFDGVALGIAE